MKKMILLLIVLSSISCSLMYEIDIEAFSTQDEIFEYVYNNIESCYDWDSIDPHLEYWQSPKESLELGTGDCDDYCILWMYLVHEYLDWSPKMLLILIPNVGGHYICTWEGIWYDPTNNWIGLPNEYPLDCVVLGSLSYEVVMLLATRGYTKAIEI